MSLNGTKPATPFGGFFITFPFSTPQKIPCNA
jgi:hypothetical protein